MRPMIAIFAIALTVVTTVADLRAEDCTSVGEGDLGFPLIEHSCFHTTNGPFNEIVATPGGVATQATANVDSVHTHYTIALSPSVANVVTYRPIRTGVWAAFGDKSPALQFLNQAGQVLPIVRSQESVACTGLGRAQLYELQAFERYSIVFAPSAAISTILVLEKVSDFRTLYGPDEDGDGVGHDHAVVTTACAPPPNYRPSTNDCDDGDAQIFPGAIEKCDGVDDDCDGDADEGVCAVTGGGCRVGGLHGSSYLIALFLAVVAGLKFRRRGGVRSRWVGLVMLVVVFDPRQAAAIECEDLGSVLVDHTCLHARLGPFKDGQAALGTQATADVDDVHTLHRIALVPQAAQFAGVVTYRPLRTGDWAIFLGVDVPLIIRDPAGREVPWTYQNKVRGCPFFSRVRVAALTADTIYRVEFDSTTASRIDLALEYIEDFLVVFGRDNDGDGFGDADNILVSACAAVAGFVPNDGDCDDTDDQRSPGAVERCDAIDWNCNGSLDDVGLSCTVGVGSCAVVGIASCPNGSLLSQCSAVAGAAIPEVCNVTDDDCDGQDDLDERALCTASDRPQCIGDSRGGRSCGCDTDADCGAITSGRICSLDGTTQLCLPGCIDGFGRNGCGPTQFCTSNDPAQPGQCVDGEPPAANAAGCCDGASTASNLTASLLLFFALNFLFWRQRSR